jgi:hypothetical protein
VASERFRHSFRLPVPGRNGRFLQYREGPVLMVKYPGAVFFLVLLLTGGLPAQPAPPVPDLSTEAGRRESAEKMRQQSTAAKAEAEAALQRRGLPLRGKTPSGRYYEVIALENGKPVYNITDNVNAAISTAADLVRNTAPFNADGSGHTVGVWDGGDIRATHQEFGGRVTVMDNAGTSYHATHVGGTIAAAGVVASAEGMAPAASLDSYDWNNDESEMTGRAAAWSGEPGRINISNHSYGLITGWDYGDWSGSTGPHWFGNWGEAEDRDFGRYDTSYAQDWDVICYAAPYYLPFKSSGNDRNDNAPSNGTTFY